MGKGKLAKFADMDVFENVFQYTYNEMAAGLLFVQRGMWNVYFGNNNPIVVELGCGRGEYTVALARRNPDVNYIGIDIKGSRMWTGAKAALSDGLKNVAFVRTGIELLQKIFAPNEVAEIWLTFPDPQMKKVRKRLTSSFFLRLYRNVLRDGGRLNLKTDSNFLFTYTTLLLQKSGIQPLEAVGDVYALNPAPGSVLSIRTYYEQQWLSRGITIKYLAFPLSLSQDYVEPDDEIEFDAYRSFGRFARTGGRTPGIAGEAPREA